MPPAAAPRDRTARRHRRAAVAAVVAAMLLPVVLLADIVAYTNRTEADQAVADEVVLATARSFGDLLQAGTPPAAAASQAVAVGRAIAARHRVVDGQRGMRLSILASGTVESAVSVRVRIGLGDLPARLAARLVGDEAAVTSTAHMTHCTDAPHLVAP